MVATKLSPIVDLADTLSPETYAIRTLAAGSVDGDYTFRLGSGIPVPLTPGWKRTVRGALALPAPGAPSFSAEVISSLYGLQAGGAGYRWAMTTLNAAGNETVPSVLSAAHIMSAQGAAILALPAGTSDPSNPGVSRRLYRYKFGTTTLYRVSDIDGIDATTFIDGVPDGSLLLPAPVSNSTAIASTISHVNGPLAAGGSGDWTQVASAPGSEQYSVDQPNGILTFAAVDAGKTVTITYTAATRIEKNIMQSLVDRANLLTRTPVDSRQVPDSDLTVPSNGGIFQPFGVLYSYTTLKANALVMVTYALAVHVLSGAAGRALISLAIVTLPDGTTVTVPNFVLANVPAGYNGPLSGSVVFDLSTGVGGQVGTFRFRFYSQSGSDLLFNEHYAVGYSPYTIQFTELPG